MKTTQENDRAKQQAKSQIESIVEMVKALDTGSDRHREEAQEAIQEDALSVEVRSDWHAPGDGDNKPTEYKILLCTGGPACKIIGELSQYGEPETARVEYQDWGTPWTEYRETTSEEDEAILTYAQQFYFGE